MSRLIVTDSGSVERIIKRLFATDSGGVERDIKRLFVIDSGGTARLIFSSGVVTVSGHTITSSSGSGPVTASLIVRADGTLDQVENGVTTQIDSATDWIIPNSAAGPAYEARITNVIGVIGGGSDFVADVWTPIDVDKQVNCRRTGADGPGQTGLTFDLEIRLGSSGGALDSGPFTMQAEIT